MSNSKKNDYEKLKSYIFRDEILLLPHKRFTGIRQSYVYARCGMSLRYFERAYKKGNVILQFGQFGPTVGAPIPWQEALSDFKSGKI